MNQKTFTFKYFHSSQYNKNYKPMGFFEIKSMVKEGLLKKGFLVEATLGFARIGPSLGARYVMNFEDNFNYWQFYAIWKF